MQYRSSEQDVARRRFELARGDVHLVALVDNLESVAQPLAQESGPACLPISTSLAPSQRAERHAVQRF